MNEATRSQYVNTVLAALRWYQYCEMGEPNKRPDWLHSIATNGDEEISMDYSGIDQFCEDLNLGKINLMNEEDIAKWDIW